MHMDSKTQSKRQPIIRHLRFWTCKDSKSRRVLEQIATLCPPFRGSRSFLSVLGKQFFHSNVSWTGWHIWWHWQRENERKTLGFQNFCSARKLWMDPVALVGRKTRARQGHLSLCTRLLPVKGKSFAWKIPAREDFFETWIVENMLQEREAGYWPSPFWWVSLPKFFGSQFRQKVWRTSSAVAKNIVGFLVSKWMRQNIAGRLASVLLFLIHFTNGFIAISSKWFSKMAK